jgi:transcriptional regulator with AAA-type ATPase domain
MSGTWNTETGARAFRPPFGALAFVLGYDDLVADRAQHLCALGPELARVRIDRAPLPADAPRASGDRIALPDPHVSSSHAVVERRGLVDRIENLSRKGTFVNGRPIEQAVLEDGDLIEIGHCLLAYRRIDPVDASGVFSAVHGRALGPTRTLAPVCLKLLAEVERFAATDRSLLLLGERGSGKEILAAHVHRHSRRAEGPFVAFDCSTLPETLVEAELFGHERGAFSGAARSRKGLLREAHGGTILLDEIGNMPQSVQQRLLRAAQQREVRPVGADHPEPIDVRWISATNADVSVAVRPDLVDRIGSLAVLVPPLRARREDLGILAAHLLRREGIAKASIAREAARLLFLHPLPGNVRDLDKLLVSAAIRAGGEKIGVSHLGASGTGATSDDPKGCQPFLAPREPPARAPRQRFPGREAIEVALERAEYVKAHAAKALGVPERTLSRWIEAAGLDPRGPRRH